MYSYGEPDLFLHLQSMEDGCGDIRTHLIEMRFKIASTFIL
jgi:hypothetical protein